MLGLYLSETATRPILEFIYHRSIASSSNRATNTDIISALNLSYRSNIDHAGSRRKGSREIPAATGAARPRFRRRPGRARRQALVYATGEITLADSPTSCYLTATFEDVDVPPEPEPGPGTDIDERVVTAVFGGMVVIAGAFFVGMSIADAVAERSRTRKQKRRCHPYALMGQWHRTSSSREDAPAPAAPPPRREPFPPPLRRAVAPFDASRAIAAWLRECEAAGIKHRMHQRKYQLGINGGRSSSSVALFL